MTATRTVAVIGGNGQLGSDIVIEFGGRGWRTIALTHADVRVDNAASVNAALADARPDVVINTAAMHVVPKCEEAPDEAFQVNAHGALNVARAASSIGARVVYVSTDYVFDGRAGDPYTEDALPQPVNVYGASKLAGEHLTLAASDRAVVVRVSGLYGQVPCRAKNGNFVTTMIRAAREKAEVRVVADEYLTPSATPAVARGLANLVEADGSGLFHLTCEGACSWYEFARAIFDELKIATPLVATSVKDSPVAVRRPHYSVLENARLKALGIPDLPPWREALRAHLAGVGVG